MIRLLHLTGADADFETRRSVHHLAHDLGPRFSCAVAQHTGIVGAFRAIRNAGEIDVLLTWNSQALSAAIFAGRGRILHRPQGGITDRGIGWLRAVMEHRPIDLISPTVTLRRRLLSRGINPARCHLIRPGVQFARIKRRRNPPMRASLGIADEDRVLLAVGESSGCAGHRELLWAASMLHSCDPRYKLLTWGQGDKTRQLRRFAIRLATPGALRIAADTMRLEFEELLGAADLIVNASDDAAPTLPMCVGMAAGLPIVSTVSSTTSELLEDRHTALLVRQGQPRLLARRVLELAADSGLQWRLADMARTEAYDFFPLTRFLDQYRTALEQAAAGQAIAVPGPPPGAGQRFHGRG
jgi:glycosyltransferase involved in cell wall biosynthesis